MGMLSRRFWREVSPKIKRRRTGHVRLGLGLRGRAGFVAGKNRETNPGVRRGTATGRPAHRRFSPIVLLGGGWGKLHWGQLPLTQNVPNCKNLQPNPCAEPYSPSPERDWLYDFLSGEPKRIVSVTRALVLSCYVSRSPSKGRTRNPWRTGSPRSCLKPSGKARGGLSLR